jgi:hypothetical protein
MATKEISGTSAAKKKASADVETKANDSDENSDLHHLSFSDSLGMESADFEVGSFDFITYQLPLSSCILCLQVGALAKRKLERSRLSLVMRLSFMRIDRALICDASLLIVKPQQREVCSEHGRARGERTR